MGNADVEDILDFSSLSIEESDGILEEKRTAGSKTCFGGECLITIVSFARRGPTSAFDFESCWFLGWEASLGVLRFITNLLTPSCMRPRLFRERSQLSQHCFCLLPHPRIITGWRIYPLFPHISKLAWHRSLVMERRLRGEWGCYRRSEIKSHSIRMCTSIVTYQFVTVENNPSTPLLCLMRACCKS